jgi:hypothetical protein
MGEAEVARQVDATPIVERFTDDETAYSPPRKRC